MRQEAETGFESSVEHEQRMRAFGTRYKVTAWECR